MISRAILRGNPRYSLSEADRVVARQVIKALREGGVLASALAKEVGCVHSLVHNWYHNAAYPGKKLYPKVLSYYERFKLNGNVP